MPILGIGPTVSCATGNIGVSMVMVRPFVKRFGSEPSNLSTLGLTTLATAALARFKARYAGEPVHCDSPPSLPAIATVAGIFFRVEPWRFSARIDGDHPCGGDGGYRAEWGEPFGSRIAVLYAGDLLMIDDQAGVAAAAVAEVAEGVGVAGGVDWLFPVDAAMGASKNKSAPARAKR